MWRGEGRKTERDGEGAADLDHGKEARVVMFRAVFHGSRAKHFIVIVVQKNVKDRAGLQAWRERRNVAVLIHH
jgi:hypothetical protein